MKHYKLRGYVTKDEYTSSNVFVEIYCKGNNYQQALKDAKKSLKRDYPFTLNHFDNINISFNWEDDE